MVEEVRRQEEGEQHAKAISMTKQGRWTNWKGLEKKKLGWHDIWQMEGARLSFVLRATNDLLPSPKKSNQKVVWRRSRLCQAPASLRHILSGCTTSLTQGGITKYSESWHQSWNRSEPPQTTSHKHQQERSTSQISYQLANVKSTKQHQRMQASCSQFETGNWK